MCANAFIWAIGTIEARWLRVHSNSSFWVSQLTCRERPNLLGE